MITSITETVKTRAKRMQAALVEAAYALFTQQGYHGTSMRQIAKDAGLAPGGIYNHCAKS